MQGTIRFTRADEKNVHSQYGEDGVLERIFNALGIDCGTAVEFGAWDGFNLSNTALLRGQGWRTVLIEADADRVAQLRTLEDKKTIVVHAFIEPSGPHSLDAILDRLQLGNVEFVSIDIDGDDLEVFRHMVRQPPVVCIEFNPSIPPPHIFSNPSGQHKGSSIAAIDEVAKDKGYDLVYATYCNAFLVRQAQSKPIQPYDAFQAFHLNSRPTVICMYDGEFRVRSERGDSVLRHPLTTVPIYVPRLPAGLLGWPPRRSKVVAAYVYCTFVAPLFYVLELLRESARQVKRLLRQRS